MNLLTPGVTGMRLIEFEIEFDQDEKDDYDDASGEPPMQEKTQKSG